MRIAALTLLAGCTQIFDLADRGPAVSGTILRREIRNDESRAPAVIETPFDTIDVTAVFDDGTRRAVRWLDDRRFWFPVARWDQPYRLVVTADGSTTEYQLDAREIRLAPSSLGRRDRAEPPPGTGLEYVVADAPTNGPAVVATTGVWTETAGPTGQNTAFTIDWRQSSGSLDGPRALIDAGQFDRTYWTHREPLTAPDGVTYWRISHYREDDVTLVGGAVTTVTGGSMPLVKGACARIDVRNGSDATRLQAAGLNMPGFGMWRLNAVPALATNVIGPGLAGAASELRDIAVDLRFGNPFPGHEPVIYTHVGIGRAVMAPGATMAAALGCGTHRWTVPTLDDCATPAATATSVGIPVRAMFNGVSLASDNQLVPFGDEQPQELRWELADNQAADHFRVLLVEAKNAALTTTLPIWATYVTAEPRLVIEPSKFVAGRLYLFVIVAVSGFPGSRDGDLVERMYPVEEVIMPTTSFFVMRASPL